MVTAVDQTSICPICVGRRSELQDCTHRTQLREGDSSLLPYSLASLCEDGEVKDKEEEEEKEEGKKKTAMNIQVTCSQHGITYFKEGMRRAQIGASQLTFRAHRRKTLIHRYSRRGLRK